MERISDLTSALIRTVEEIYEARGVGCEVIFNHTKSPFLFIIYEEDEKPQFDYPLNKGITAWAQFHTELPSRLKYRGIQIPYTCISRKRLEAIKRGEE